METDISRRPHRLGLDTGLNNPKIHRYDLEPYKYIIWPNHAPRSAFHRHQQVRNECFIVASLSSRCFTLFVPNVSRALQSFLLPNLICVEPLTTVHSMTLPNFACVSVRAMPVVRMAGYETCGCDLIQRSSTTRPVLSCLVAYPTSHSITSKEKKRECTNISVGRTRWNSALFAGLQH